MAILNYTIYTFLCIFLVLISSTFASGFFSSVREKLADGVSNAADAVVDISKCLFGECCNDQFIPGNFIGILNCLVFWSCWRKFPIRVVGLRQNLTQDLFGQHLVIDLLPNVLHGHAADGAHSRRPLVLSFQGPPGTGKTYVTDRIADYMYRLGGRSRFVKKFMGRLDFTRESNVEEYKVCMFLFTFMDLLLKIIIWRFRFARKQLEAPFWQC